jgi:hypothetical protein
LEKVSEEQGLAKGGGGVETRDTGEEIIGNIQSEGGDEVEWVLGWVEGSVPAV